MAENATRRKTLFLADGTLDRLTEGSYEHRQLLLKSALAEDLPGAEVVATYPMCVVCRAADDRFIKVPYVYRDGSIELGEEIALAVPVLSEEQIAEKVETLVEAAIKDLLFGNKMQGMSRLQTALRGVTESTSNRLLERVQLGVLIERLKETTPWMRLYDRKRLTIRRLIGDKLSEARGEHPLPSFSFLDGMDSAADVERYHENVTAALRELGQRIDGLGQSVRQSLDRLPKGAFGEDGILEVSFGTFAEDLSADLGTHSRSALGLAERARDTRGLARYHDALAKRFRVFEEASRFVRLVTTRLDTER